MNGIQYSFGLLNEPLLQNHSLSLSRALIFVAALTRDMQSDSTHLKSTPAGCMRLAHNNSRMDPYSFRRQFPVIRNHFQTCSACCQIVHNQTAASLYFTCLGKGSNGTTHHSLLDPLTWQPRRDGDINKETTVFCLC
jgi:hypothetical protein